MPPWQGVIEAGETRQAPGAAPAALPAVEFFAVGTPVAQPRPRFNRKSGNVYNPDDADGWKQRIMHAAHRLAPKPALRGPLQVDVDFIFPRPARLGNGPEVPHDEKPDRDNLDKVVLDTLKQLGFFDKDDCQVAFGCIRKFYAATGENAGAAVKITPLTPQGGPAANNPSVPANGEASKSERRPTMK